MEKYVPKLEEIEYYPDDVLFKITPYFVEAALNQFKNQLYNRELYTRCKANKLTDNELKEYISLIENNFSIIKGNNDRNQYVINKKVLYIILKYTGIGMSYEVKDYIELEKAISSLLEKKIKNNVELNIYNKISNISNIDDSRYILEIINKSNLDNKRYLLLFLKIKTINYINELRKEVIDFVNNI